MMEYTNANLELQFDLMEIVQSTKLDMYESEYHIVAYQVENPESIFKPRGTPNQNRPLVLIDLATRYCNSNQSVGDVVGTAIDLNNNRFGEWLDKVFGEIQYCSFEDAICQLTNSLADYYKVQIALHGLTDTTLNQLIQSVKNVKTN